MDRIYSETETDRLHRAAKEGKAWATGLKIGDRFAGAIPAARERGFADHTLEQAVFVSIALNNLPHIYVAPHSLVIARIDPTH